MSRFLVVVLFLVFVGWSCGGDRSQVPSASNPGSPEMPSDSGQPPVKVAAGSYRCPTEAPYLVLRGRYYPPGYPLRPPGDVRPDRCFRSSSEVRLSGVRIAATPKGDIDVGGVYLVPAATSVSSLCMAAAKVTTFPVPCPTMVPYPADSVGFCGGTGQMCWTRSGFLLLGYFQGPPSYHGVDGTRQGHLWIEAATPDSIDSINCCGATLVSRRTGPFDRSARWLVFPNGSHGNSGHVVLEWRLHGAVYAVSLHGHGAINYRLDLAIAEHLRFIG